ncbi:hypothetical protein DACRYDRAFT_103096 [Dacryopinax primogenitus]|uniref:DUF7330 domain-containing protein n=1 Tax=Dacryopinax primogenitus (strain DJM 731) TaxID=1858805 RepID=M5GB43_DACPD|nr:uncharacterized protein DACRYDRAFT_103096 [Dacryopinax primogenitus]EJU06149.1 hypothetical protein DACRYDRAFT_103096 [Dacryopinax primogenitus]
MTITSNNRATEDEFVGAEPWSEADALPPPAYEDRPFRNVPGQGSSRGRRRRTGYPQEKRDGTPAPPTDMPVYLPQLTRTPSASSTNSNLTVQDLPITPPRSNREVAAPSVSGATSSSPSQMRQSSIPWDSSRSRASSISSTTSSTSVQACPSATPYSPSGMRVQSASVTKSSAVPVHDGRKSAILSTANLGRPSSLSSTANPIIRDVAPSYPAPMRGSMYITNPDTFDASTPSSAHTTIPPVPHANTSVPSTPLSEPELSQPTPPTITYPADFPSHLARQNGVRIRRAGDVRETFLIDSALPALEGGADKALDIETGSAVDARVYVIGTGAAPSTSEKATEMAFKAASIKMTVVQAIGNPLLKLQFQPEKPRTRAKDPLEVHLCTGVRVSLEAFWPGDCIIRLPPTFTGKVDLRFGKRGTVDIDKNLALRTRILNEEQGVMLFWIGDYETGKGEWEFDKCFIRAEGRISIGVWEADSENKTKTPPAWDTASIASSKRGQALDRIKGVASRIPSVNLYKKLKGNTEKPYLATLD